MADEFERYENHPKLREFASSLTGVRIVGAKIVENKYSNVCVLRQRLDDGRTIEIGVSGNLYDEAYFVFEEVH